MALTIHQLQRRSCGAAAWDDFGTIVADGTVFPSHPWKRVVESVFRMTPHYLFAAEGR